jgi:hypothetical protein
MIRKRFYANFIEEHAAAPMVIKISLQDRTVFLDKKNKQWDYPNVKPPVSSTRPAIESCVYLRSDFDFDDVGQVTLPGSPISPATASTTGVDQLLRPSPVAQPTTQSIPDATTDSTARHEAGIGLSSSQPTNTRRGNPILHVLIPPRRHKEKASTNLATGLISRPLPPHVSFRDGPVRTEDILRATQKIDVVEGAYKEASAINAKLDAYYSSQQYALKELIGQPDGASSIASLRARVFELERKNKDKEEIMDIFRDAFTASNSAVPNRKELKRTLESIAYQSRIALYTSDITGMRTDVRLQDL